MWPASHSSRSRTSSTWTPSRSASQRSCRSSRVDALDPLDGAALLAPARHAAGEVADDARDADGGGELRGAPRVGVVAAHEHDLLLAVGQPRELGAEAGRSAVIATAPPTWASSNCRSVRMSTTSAPSARLSSTWRGVSGRASARSAIWRPRLISTIARKFGGCGPSAASDAARTRPRPAPRAVRCGPTRTRPSRPPSCPSRARRTATRRDVRATPPSTRAARAAAAATRTLLARPPGGRPPGRAGRCRPRTGSRRSGRPTARARARCR